MARTLPSLKLVGAAALVSVIAGVLVSHECGRAAESRLVRVTPASVEMMQLLRDEHGLMADMIKVEVANEERAALSGIDRD